MRLTNKYGGHQHVIVLFFDTIAASKAVDTNPNDYSSWLVVSNLKTLPLSLFDERMHLLEGWNDTGVLGHLLFHVWNGR